MNYLGLYSNFKIVYPKLIIKDNDTIMCMFIIPYVSEYSECDLCDLNYIEYKSECSKINEIFNCMNLKVAISIIRFHSLFNISYIKYRGYKYDSKEYR